jgi:hypothetical protein
MLEQLTQQLGGINDIIGVVFRSESFINSLWEVLHDVRTAGLGVFLILDNADNDDEPALFQCVAQDEVAVEDGPDGRDIGVYRAKLIRLSFITKLWSDAVIPKELAELKGDGKKDPEVQLTEATYKEGNRWLYRVMWRKGGKGDVLDVVKREYATDPFIPFHWSKIPGCEYGPGPVLLMLPDARTVNKVMEYVLKNAALALAGMYMVISLNTYFFNILELL